MKKIFPIFFLLLCVAATAGAQALNYVFSQSAGSFTPNPNPTVVASATANSGLSASLDNVVFPLPLPFPFTFDGTVYNDCNISTNGFITFGTTAPSVSNYTPISSSAAYAGAIAAWARDLNAVFNLGSPGQTGNINYEVVGSAPNQELIIEWKNFRPDYSSSTTSAYAFSFQIHLHETSNQIKIVYGPGSYLVGSTSYSDPVEVGLRSATNSSYFNRSNNYTVAFSASSAGTSNSATQNFSTTAATPGMPPSGLTYTYTWVNCISPVSIHTTNITTNSADVNLTSNAPQWQISYATGTSFAPGAGTHITTSSNPYTLSPLTPSTQYSYFVRAICGPGDTSVWSFRDNFTTIATCDTPTTPLSSNLTPTSADLGWTENGSATQWQISYATGSSFAANNGTKVLATSNPYTVTGLQQGTTYTYFVRAICGAGDTSFWSARSAAFTTVITCPAPTALTASSITANSADLGWTENGTATQWEIEYSTGTTFTLGTGTRQMAGTNPYNLTSLNPASQYSYFVRAVCSAGDTSKWSARHSFTTQCVPLTNLNEAFTSYLPPCWTERVGKLGASPTLTGTSSGWASDDWLNVVANGKAAKVNLYQALKKDWLISPTIDLGAAGGNVQFDLAIVSFGAATPGTLGSDDTVAVVISTDDGATWSLTNILQMWTAASGTLSANGTLHVALPLGAYSGLVKLGIYGSEGTTDDAVDNDIMIDNFVVSPFPLAIRLQDIQAVNETAVNKITWSTADEAQGDQFELERSADGREYTAIHTRSANAVASSYHHTDVNPVKGVNYYRLKMIDGNGKTAYSKVVTAVAGGKDGFLVRAFPNPVTGNKLTVEITGTMDKSPVITLTDVAGKVVRMYQVKNPRTDIDMSELTPGIYFVKYTDASQSHTLKVSK